MRTARLQPTVLCAALLATACSRGADVPPLVCPPGTEVSVVQYPSERGGGHGERCMRPDGTREGPSYDYYEDGSIHSITNWSEGARHGKSTVWHRNGVKAEELEHDHFVAVGTWRKWDEEGRLLAETDSGPAAATPGPPDAATPKPSPPASGS